MIPAHIVVLLIAGWCAGGCDRNAQTPPAGSDSVAIILPPDARALVDSARVHDRADRRDSARLAYLAAARRIPEIADWLVLRAAGVTRDSADRASLYTKLETEVARDRVAWTEALARERMGDIEGAIRAYEKVGAPLSALRLRHARARDAAARDEVRADLVALLGRNPGSDLVRDGVAMFDQLFERPTAREQLSMARAAASVGLSVRAAAGFRAALAAGLGTARDRFTYGTVLARLNLDREAAAQFARVSAPPPLAAAAQYQRARAQIAYGDVAAARRTLRAITTRWPGDTSAASALMLLADLATDENRDAAARDALREAARRFPASGHAPVALFRAAMIAFIRGDHRSAADEFSAVASRYPRSEEAAAGRYWAGRALAASGERARAQAAWRDVLARDTGSYYAVLAATRLDTTFSLGTASPREPPRIAELEAALARIALLDTLGMTVEQRHEYDRLFRDASHSSDRMIATVRAFSGTGQASRAVALGWRIINETGRSPDNYRLVYPLLERERIAREARANGLDPALVAALIRQESNFNPRATSPVGARGLMQVMPELGRRLAVRYAVSDFTPDRLYDPAVNIPLGTAHLRNLLAGYPNVVRALAAYNAGASRVERWARKAGAEDPEVFTERIPFVETRGYVRALVRNRALYRVLYSW